MGTLNAIDPYTERVMAYARYRWEFAPEAVQAFLASCGLTPEWVVADVGSGTGMVARHLVERARAVLAVEPNAAMRRAAFEGLGHHPSYRAVGASSDATGLGDSSVDLITVGRAVHWFPAASTRAEFTRILRPAGWLAILTTPCTDRGFLDSLETVKREENGWDRAADRHALEAVPTAFYFGHDEVQTICWPGVAQETWEAFLGRMSSRLSTPQPGHPLRSKFERALRDVFERHARDGVLSVSYETAIEFGRVREGRTA
jgi:SAM-dependent methyltransferase